MANAGGGEGGGWSSCIVDVGDPNPDIDHPRTSLRSIETGSIFGYGCSADIESELESDHESGLFVLRLGLRLVREFHGYQMRNDDG